MAGSRRARKELKLKQTRDILRDRDRKTSSIDQLLPPDSETPPTRVLRSNITPYRLSACLSPAKVLRDKTATSKLLIPRDPLKTQNKKVTREEKKVARIEKRTRLLSTEATEIVNTFDLTHIDPDIDTDTPAGDNKLPILQDDVRSLNVFFYLGFAGYPKQTTGQSRRLYLHCLQSPPDFQNFMYRTLNHQLSTMGLCKQDVEIAGYEVLFAIDCILPQVNILAGQRVLVRSSNILVEWAEQAMNHRSTSPHEITMRIVKSDGTMFDPAFRTLKEIMATPLTPDDSIEPGMQDDARKVNPEPRGKSRSSKETKRARRKTTRSLQSEVQADTAREKAVRKQKIRSDMILIESMMGRQQLSSDPSQRSDKIEHTERDLEHVEQDMSDLDMSG